MGRVRRVEHSGTGGAEGRSYDSLRLGREHKVL